MKGGEERQEGQVRKTYRLVRPLRRLRLELRAVPNLQRSRRPPREEIRDLLPRQALVLLQVDQELVVFGRKLELGPSRLLRWRGIPAWPTMLGAPPPPSSCLIILAGGPVSGSRWW